MIRTISATLAAVVIASALVAVTPAFAQKKLGGTGAPQSENCAAKGGTENGQMCDLPNGTSCQSMLYAREGACYNAESVLIAGTGFEDEDKEEDVGTNDGSDQSGDSGGDTQSE